MTKKLLSIFMALVMCCGVFAVAAHAEDTTEPEVPETPAYTPVEYKIEDIIAALQAGDDVYFQPTDIILLPISAEEPDDPEEPVEAADDTDTPAVSDVLIVEYLPGTDAASQSKGVTKFLDFQSTNYTVRAVGESTDFVLESGTQKSGRSYSIDFEHSAGYAFKSWRVDNAYSGKEFNRIVLTAQWDVPTYHGWQGFKAMMADYAKTFIDYLINYLADLMQRITSFFV